MIKKIKIYDIDGTLVDSLHRYRTKNDRIDLDYWLENDVPEKIALDTLLPLARRYQQDLKNPDVYTILATARACAKNDANYKYISDVLGEPDKFIHRKKQGDTRGGAELKLAAIKPMLNLRQFQNAEVHVFEDNLAYLGAMCYSLNAVGHFNPSKQGH